MRSNYFQKWLKELNIIDLGNMSFTFFDFRFDFAYRTYHGSTTFKNTIAIFDIQTDWILHEYSKYDIGYDEHPLFFDKEKQEKELLKVLIKIIADVPLFYKRKIELRNFNEVNRDTFLSLSGNNFSIDSFFVYKYFSNSEKRIRYRVGKDDTYEITEETKWFATFNDVIIENEYIRSLLPPNNINKWTEEIYGPGIIGTPTKTFEFDLKETERFRSIFDKNEFINKNSR